MWRNKNEDIKRETLFNGIFKGGLGLHNVVVRCRAHLIMHVVRLIQNRDSRWVFLANYWIGLNIREFKGWDNNFPHSFDTPVYYREALLAFKTFMNNYPDFYFNSASIRVICDNMQKKNIHIPRIEMISRGIDFSEVWGSCHNKFVSPDVRNLSFRISHDVVSLNFKLWGFGIYHSKLCVLCGKSEESMEHLFFLCPKVYVLWLEMEKVFSGICNHRLKLSPVIVLFKQLKNYNFSKFCKDLLIMLMGELLFSVWVHRNNVKYECKMPDSHVILELFLFRLKQRCVIDFSRFDNMSFDHKWCINNIVASTDGFDFVFLMGDRVKI
jgi:hypothetical protein